MSICHSKYTRLWKKLVNQELNTIFRFEPILTLNCLETTLCCGSQHLPIQPMSSVKWWWEKQNTSQKRIWLYGSEFPYTLCYHQTSWWCWPDTPPPFILSLHLRIPRIQGMAETSLQADAELSSMTHRKAWSRPPIEVDFQVLMFTASGLLVRFLKVFEKSNYQSVKVSCHVDIELRATLFKLWHFLLLFPTPFLSGCDISVEPMVPISFGSKSNIIVIVSVPARTAHILANWERPLLKLCGYILILN